MTKSNLIPFDQIKEPLRLPKQEICSEQVLPTPFPQGGDILTEEEDSESEQELIA